MYSTFLARNFLTKHKIKTVSLRISNIVADVSKRMKVETVYVAVTLRTIIWARETCLEVPDINSQ